jgi:predicted amidohydrolase
MWHAIIGHSHGKLEVQRHAVGKTKPVLELNPLCRALLANRWLFGRSHLADPWGKGVGDGGNNGAGRGVLL